MKVIHVIVLSICVRVYAGSGFGEEKSESSRALCDQICESDVRDVKVCGSDGKLYGSMCEFERAKCVAESSGTTLKVYSEGECITLNSSCDIFQDANVKCSEPGLEFICASNNLTYDSVCEFMVAKCKQHHSYDLDVLHTGACIYDISSATQIDCSQFAIDTSGVAFENGTLVKYTFECHHHPHDEICLLNGRTYRGSCNYCEHLFMQGIITPTYTIAYIDHTGKCTHTAVIG